MCRESVMSRPLPPLAVRIENSIVRMPWSGCWLWTGSVGKLGYGIIKVDGTHANAHRVVWRQYRGDIPEGAILLHSCDIPGCVNPNHLAIGTFRDNSRDMVRKGRNVAPRRADGLCKRGHPLIEKPANWGKGRYCPVCKNRHNRKEPK